MAQLSAYLHFNGNCADAMTFYQQCLGGELNMQTIGDSSIANEMPAETRQHIMHASLSKTGTDGFVLLASDMAGSEGVIRGNNFTLCLNCSSAEEIQTLFAKLAAGGQITQPLIEAFWGGTFGQLTDKFGTNWMFNHDKNVQG